VIDEEPEPIDIAEFFKQNSSLFVVLGVFSALAIYISELSDAPLSSAPLESRIGFAGSLLLSALLVVAVYGELINEAGSVEKLVILHTKFKNWDLMLLTAGMVFLFPSLITPLLRQTSTLYYFLGFIALIFSLPVLFRIVLIVNNQLVENDLLRYLQLAGASLAVLIISSNYFEYVVSNPQLTGSNSFSLSNFEPLFYDVTGTIAALLRVLSVLLLGFYSSSTLITLYKEMKSHIQSADSYISDFIKKYK
jgi:hypothetical protein